MRVVAIVLAVLALIAILYFAGVGRSGMKTCVRECETEHCGQLTAGEIRCGKNQAAYDACLADCREKHGSE